MKRTLRLIFAICLVLSPIRAARSDEAPKGSDAPSASKQPEPTHPFLGVVVTSAHPALASNLKDLLSPEQGLTVEMIANDSPASKAGIKLHDVLTTYDDQKLFSAEQLAKLVHSDKADRQVTIEYLRHGKLHKAQITLGQAETPQSPIWNPFAEELYRSRRPDRLWPRLRLRPSTPSDWESFDSLTLKKLGEDKFRAEVQYLDKDGKTQKYAFEGSREEIRKTIEAHKDLKPPEKMHLLRSLNMHGTTDESTSSGFWIEPGYGWLFDQPPAEFR